MSLHRTRADWPIVAAAGLITLLAAVLLAAGAIYPAAAAESGLRRTFADAPPSDANVSVGRYEETEGAQAADDLVQSRLRGAFGGISGEIIRDWRGSGTLQLPELPRSQAGDQAILGYLDRLEEHAKLLEGAWPASFESPTGPIQAVISEAVALELGIRLDDRVQLVAHPSTQPIRIPVDIVGIFAIDDPDDPYWNEDEQLLAGTRENGQYRTLGPFLTTREDLLARTDGTVRLEWRTFMDFGGLTVDQVVPLRRNVEALPDVLRAGGGEGYEVVTELGTMLASAERSLLVSRTGVLLLMAQLAILAAYAIVLTASLLVDHRRIDTALLRSRGAGPGQVALLALAEGLLLAVPAVLVAPWLAAAALDVLNVAGPLAAVGLRIEPRVTPDAYVAAGAAGLGAALLLAMPALLAARSFASEQGGLSRQETRTFGQRMGLDIALLGLTGIALWQLRLYGAPLTRTVQGSVGLDPLLVAAPAIGLVAGGVLALRVLPLLAQVAERAVTRGRDLVVSLGSRQLARRPLRYTRSALLLMLAMSMGVFALSYADTWASSQRDQAAYQAGADVRVEPGHSFASLPTWALPGAYGAIDGVDQVTPVERIPSRVSFLTARSVDLLAIDAAAASDVLLLRGDEAATPLGPLFDAMVAGRSTAALRPFPDGSTQVRIVPRLEVEGLRKFIFDPETGEGRDEQVAPEDVAIRISVNGFVRDAHGQLYRIDSPLAAWTGAGTEIVVALAPADPRAANAVAAGAQLAGPLELVGVGIELWLPLDILFSEGRLGIASLAAAPGTDGPWTDVPLTGGDPWVTNYGRSREPLATVARGAAEPVYAVTGNNPDRFIFGNASASPAARIAFLPQSIQAPAEGVPVIVNPAFLETTGTDRDDTFTATLDGATRHFRIAGVTNTFPTTDPTRPLLIIDASTLGLLRLQSTGTTREPDEWWVATRDGAAEAVAAKLAQEPFDSTSVVTFVGRTRSLSTDPVALGIIGALSLGFVATGLFAVVGLTVSGAVSARQRRTEFALLRALGISGRQLLSSLWLENGTVVLVSLVAGTSLGLLLGWTVLPFTTVTQQAAAPVPSVIVHVPWDRIAILETISALALAVSVIVIGGVLRRLGVGSVLRMGED